jgi:hypothetical protein
MPRGKWAVKWQPGPPNSMGGSYYSLNPRKILLGAWPHFPTLRNTGHILGTWGVTWGHTWQQTWETEKSKASVSSPVLFSQRLGHCIFMNWFLLAEVQEAQGKEPRKLDHSPSELLRLCVTRWHLLGYSANCSPGGAASARQSVSHIYWEVASNVNW